MASGFCTAWMNLILDEIFGAVDITKPGTLYFGLCTGGVSAAGVVTGEPSGNGYARKDITNDKNLWTDAAAGALENEVAITFAQASGSWGTVAYFFIANHLTDTGSAIIAYGELTTPKAIDNGDTAQFAIGDLDISLTASS